MSLNNKATQKKADDKRKNERSRNWTVILYPDDISKDFIEKISSFGCQWVLSPKHDSDVSAIGEVKKAHYHTLLMFGTHKSVSQINALFGNAFEYSGTSIIGVATITAQQIVGDKCGLIKYFTHSEYDNKAQYSVDDIKCFNGADILELLKRNTTENMCILQEMEKFIEVNKITEMAELSKRIRMINHTEWYHILTSKNTVYFRGLLESRRGMAKSEIEHYRLTGEVFVPVNYTIFNGQVLYDDELKAPQVTYDDKLKLTINTETGEVIVKDKT